MSRLATFEEEIARLRSEIAATPAGEERDRLCIALGATVATEELTRPERGLAEIIMASQLKTHCLPEPDDVDVPELSRSQPLHKEHTPMPNG